MRIINLVMLEEMLSNCEKRGVVVPKQLRELHNAAIGKQGLRRSAKADTWLPMHFLNQYVEYIQTVVTEPKSDMFQILFMAREEYSSVNAMLAYLLRFQVERKKVFELVANTEPRYYTKLHTAIYRLEDAQVRLSYTHTKLLFAYPHQAAEIVNFFIALSGNQFEKELFTTFHDAYSYIESHVAAAQHNRYGNPHAAASLSESLKTFINHMRGRDYFDQDLLEFAMLNLQHIQSIHIGVLRLSQASAFHGVYRQLIFTYPNKADLLGSIIRLLPTDEYRLQFAVKDFEDFSIPALEKISSNVERLKYQRKLTLSKFKDMLDLPSSTPPKLTLNGEDFEWQDYLAGGRGQIQAYWDAQEYRKGLWHNRGLLFTRPDPRLEEESEYITLDDGEQDDNSQPYDEFTDDEYATDSDDEHDNNATKLGDEADDETQSAQDNRFKSMWGFRI